jgi:hypothetical protein
MSAIVTKRGEEYRRRFVLAAAAPNNNDEENPTQDVPNRLDDDDDDDDDDDEHWLDRPFFDPDNYIDDESSSALGKFARLVKNDYNLAETLYAGCFIAFMIVVSQEMLRFQIHGSNYIPFHAGGTNPLWN